MKERTRATVFSAATTGYVAQSLLAIEGLSARALIPHSAFYVNPVENFLGEHTGDLGLIGYSVLSSLIIGSLLPPSYQKKISVASVAAASALTVFIETNRVWGTPDLLDIPYPLVAAGLFAVSILSRPPRKTTYR